MAFVLCSTLHLNMTTRYRIKDLTQPESHFFYNSRSKLVNSYRKIYRLRPQEIEFTGQGFCTIRTGRADTNLDRAARRKQQDRKTNPKFQDIEKDGGRHGGFRLIRSVTLSRHRSVGTVTLREYVYGDLWETKEDYELRTTR